ncbi:AraC family transcriptional regulator N-terminal domain-containing protein, partial [Pseudomonas syringae pv. tagetis]|uniref:AraC family transcriptional regulator N-terminal domain-containing protein n=1 Tax=Pseudomonas syringae group genomosp. 7 TaxID=251699 RepID=UPI00377021C5
ARPPHGVAAAIDRGALGELVQAMGPASGQQSQAQTPESMTSVRIDTAMRDSLERLLRCLHDPQEFQAMGQSRIREVLYSALRRP